MGHSVCRSFLAACLLCEGHDAFLSSIGAFEEMQFCKYSLLLHAVISRQACSCAAAQLPGPFAAFTACVKIQYGPCLLEPGSQRRERNPLSLRLQSLSSKK